MAWNQIPPTSSLLSGIVCNSPPLWDKETGDLSLKVQINRYKQKVTKIKMQSLSASSVHGQPLWMLWYLTSLTAEWCSVYISSGIRAPTTRHLILRYLSFSTPSCSHRLLWSSVAICFPNIRSQTCSRGDPGIKIFLDNWKLFKEIKGNLKEGFSRKLSSERRLRRGLKTRSIILTSSGSKSLKSDT